MTPAPARLFRTGYRDGVGLATGVAMSLVGAGTGVAAPGAAGVAAAHGEPEPSDVVLGVVVLGGLNDGTGVALTGTGADVAVPLPGEIAAALVGTGVAVAVPFALIVGTGVAPVGAGRGTAVPLALADGTGVAHPAAGGSG